MLAELLMYSTNFELEVRQEAQPYMKRTRANGEEARRFEYKTAAKSACHMYP